MPAYFRYNRHTSAFLKLKISFGQVSKNDSSTLLPTSCLFLHLKAKDGAEVPSLTQTIEGLRQSKQKEKPVAWEAERSSFNKRRLSPDKVLKEGRSEREGGGGWRWGEYTAPREE